MKAGLWIYGLATVITGLVDIAWGALEPSHQPIQALGIPAPMAQRLAYLAGAWLVAAGIAILWERTERIGAAGSAMIYLAFALLSVPRFYTATHAFGFRIGVLIFVIFAICQQLLLVTPAILVYAISAYTDPVWRERAAVAARWTLGLGPIAFGLGHLISPLIMARFVPHWVPIPMFWAVFTGIAFLLSGLAIVSKIQDVLAARLLGLMLLLFEAAVEVPPVFAQPHSQTAWGGAIYNLTAIAACLMFSEFVLSRRQTARTENSVAPQPATQYSNVLSA